MVRAMKLGSAAFVILAACTDALPCSVCPAMEGTYAATWETAVNSGCPAQAVSRPTTLTFTRVGSSITTLLAGQQLTGTLFDTYDFTATGGFETFYSLRGRLVVPTSADAGSAVHLTGALRSSFAADAGSTCELEEKFTAKKL
jgi:hypothetical protein